MALSQLVGGAWLEAELGAADLRVLECTMTLSGTAAVSGRGDWEAGHIPGSAYVDVIDELSEPHPTLQFTFPSPERFAAAMSALGVEDGTRVVLYDRGGPMWATRVWWLLRAYGFDDAAVLDGGFEAWTGPVSTDPAPHRRATFIPRPRPELIAGRDEVQAGGACLINALPPAAIDGKSIPGSLRIASQGLLVPGTRRFLPADQLRERLAPVAAGRVIAYCGGGISATVDAFALTLVGARDVAVYDGSMREWLSDPALPVEVE